MNKTIWANYNPLIQLPHLHRAICSLKRRKKTGMIGGRRRMKRRDRGKKEKSDEGEVKRSIIVWDYT